MGRFSFALERMFNYLKDPKVYLIGFVATIIAGLVGYIPMFILFMLGALTGSVGVVFIILAFLWGIADLFIFQIPVASVFARIDKGLSVSASIAEGIRHVKEMGIATIAYLILTGTLIVIGYIMIIAGPTTTPALTVLGLIVLFVGFIVALICGIVFYPLLPVAYKERLGLAALSRSFSLVKSGLLPTIGMWFVTYAIASIVSMILYFGFYFIAVIGFVISPSVWSSNPAAMNPAAMAIVGILAVIFMLLMVVVISVIYLASTYATYEALAGSGTGPKPRPIIRHPPKVRRTKKAKTVKKRR